MASGPITSWQIDGEIVETVADYFWWVPKSLLMVIAAMKLKFSVFRELPNMGYMYLHEQNNAVCRLLFMASLN